MLELEIELIRDRKLARVNGSEKARLSQLLGTMQVIEILPQDYLLIDGEPARRRKFLDLAISQWDERYYLHCVRYYQGLRQRNRSLQRGPDLERAGIRVWNKILEEHGAYVIWRRKQVLQSLNPELRSLHAGVAEKDEEVEVLYRSSIEGDSLEEIQTNFCEKLLQAEERDILFRCTREGPHRDDLSFMMDAREIKNFGSEGQKRSLVIALKLTLGDFLKKREGKTPFFILDDVLTQLDERRRKGLMQVLSPYQSFVSITAIDFHRDLIPQGKWFGVKSGQYEEASA